MRSHVKTILKFNYKKPEVSFSGQTPNGSWPWSPGQPHLEDPLCSISYSVLAVITHSHAGGGRGPEKKVLPGFPQPRGADPELHRTPRWKPTKPACSTTGETPRAVNKLTPGLPGAPGRQAATTPQMLQFQRRNGQTYEIQQGPEPEPGAQGTVVQDKGDISAWLQERQTSISRTGSAIGRKINYFLIK